MPPTVAQRALRTAIPPRYAEHRERVLRILDRWARTTGQLMMAPPPAHQAPTRP